MKESIAYIKGTWIHLIVRGEDVGEKLDKAVAEYIKKNNKTPEGYLIQEGTCSNT